MGTGRQRKARMGMTHRKCLMQLIVQYTGWILQHNVSLTYFITLCPQPYKLSRVKLPPYHVT